MKYAVVTHIFESDSSFGLTTIGYSHYT